MESASTLAQPLQDGEASSDTSSSLSSTRSDDDATEEEYADLAGAFDVCIPITPNFNAVRVRECAEAFRNDIHRMINIRAPGMPPSERLLLESTVNFIFQDVFGMRAKRRLHILQNSQAMSLHGPPLLDQAIPGIIKPFLKNYHAWKFAGNLSGIKFEILGLHYANRMYNEYKVLCQDDTGAMNELLVANGFTPTMGRRRNDLILECLAKGLGVNEYAFTQSVKDTQCISTLADAFGLGILILLPHMTIDCLKIWNPTPGHIISLIDASFRSQAVLVCRAAYDAVLEPILYTARIRSLPLRLECDNMSLLESFTTTDATGRQALLDEVFTPAVLAGQTS
ncbi:hypothetical protein V500_01402 [Pseudogymnoascus sp. VKM F-4518 (FW-2643)]|nr:hypothetical protein V500_01402 [Pseudogymnoascus sp. VKM F-4518 (FW-2643)]